MGERIIGESGHAAMISCMRQGEKSDYSGSCRMDVDDADGANVLRMEWMDTVVGGE